MGAYLDFPVKCVLVVCESEYNGKVGVVAHLKSKSFAT